MSVRKGDRSQGREQLQNQIRILRDYSLQLLRSHNHFPKGTRWLYAYPIADELRAASLAIKYLCVTQGNDTASQNFRRQQQIAGHAHLEGLLELIDDAYKATYIEGRQVEYWTRLIVTTDTLLLEYI